jgi:hypothetical protein
MCRDDANVFPQSLLQNAREGPPNGWAITIVLYDSRTMVRCALTRALPSRVHDS